MSANISSRVFLARLAGTAVFDPNGDPVGKVRDAVATLRANNQPPRILGEVATRDFLKDQLEDIAKEIVEELRRDSEPDAKK